MSNNNSNRKTILIVEDDELSVKFVERMLNQAGYNVVVAMSGEEAIRLVTANEHIDLILMDIELDDQMDGTEAARRILEIHRIPIVFLSSHTDREYVERIQGITGYGYVVKGTGYAVLKYSIEMALNLFEAEMRVRENERKLIETSEAERQTIGQDLHDGLGQYLTAISFRNKILENKLKSAESPDYELAREVTLMIHRASVQMRNLSKHLFPVELEKQGLEMALMDFALFIERQHEISCKLECRFGDVLPAVNVQLNVYRIIQESVANAVKHAKAEHITIRASTAQGKFCFEVENDGMPFPLTAETAGEGVGMQIMRYRARVLRGNLTVKSLEGAGTVVSCSFPLDRG